MFNLADIVSLSKRALYKYNKNLTSLFTDNIALNIWSEGGEWPQYHKRYDNLFSYIHTLVPRAVNYVSCMSIPSVVSHIQFCRQSSTICAMRVPYYSSFRLSILHHLVDTSKTNKVTIIVRSASSAQYIKSKIAEYDLNAFLKGTKIKSIAASVEILSPAMVLDHFLANNKTKYDTLVLYDADTMTATYGLFAKLLPYISEFPVYISVAESDMNAHCTLLAQNAKVCPVDEIPTLYVGHTNDREVLPSNVVLDLPLATFTRVCDSQTRVLPVIGPDNRFTLLTRSATIEEKTRLAYWTLANGYHLVKKPNSAETANTNDVALYDRFDYYASLLWAMEVTTGVSSGNVITARHIWKFAGLYIPVVLDPISAHLGGMCYGNTCRYLKQGCNNKDITWKLYYYTNLLHTVFTYEQSLVVYDGGIVTLRVGYVFKPNRPVVCRIMTQIPASLSKSQYNVKPHYKMLSQYRISRIDSHYIGLDIRTDDTAYCRYDSEVCTEPSEMWSFVCSILSAQRFIELQFIVTLWNVVTCSPVELSCWSSVINTFMTKLVGTLE